MKQRRLAKASLLFQLQHIDVRAPRRSGRRGRIRVNDFAGYPIQPDNHAPNWICRCFIREQKAPYGFILFIVGEGTLNFILP